MEEWHIYDIPPIRNKTTPKPVVTPMDSSERSRRENVVNILVFVWFCELEKDRIRQRCGRSREHVIFSLDQNMCFL